MCNQIILSRLVSTLTLLGTLCSCSATSEPESLHNSQKLGQAADGGPADPAECPLDAVDGASEDGGSSRSGSKGPRLSEVVIDPPGADGNNEFVEIAGEPCDDLGGLYLVCIEGDSESNPGNLDRVINLQTVCGSNFCHLGPSGLLVVTAVGGWHKPSNSTATWAPSSALVGGGLENGTTTLLLLQCTTPPIAASDWDPANTGTLQVAPACHTVDSLAWLDRATGDFPYSDTRIGPKPSPSAAVRCDSSSAESWWYFGELGNGAQGITFAGALSEGAPAAAVLTPGLPNDCPSQIPIVDGSASVD